MNFNNLRRPKADMLWVAGAGPASNLAQLVIWALVAAVLARVVSPTGLVGGFWLSVANAGIQVNSPHQANMPKKLSKSRASVERR